MAVQTLHLEHIPLQYPIHIALFKDVENCAFLKQQLLSGNEKFEYAFIDASVILSTVHALAAAYRAVTDLLNSRIRSRNVHSEMVFALSPNNNLFAELVLRAGGNTTLKKCATKLSVIPGIGVLPPPGADFTKNTFFLATNRFAHLLTCLCLQIAESFRRFGISDTTTSLLVIKVSTSPSITHETVAQHLGDVVKGTPAEFSDETLSEMADLGRIRKIYKINVCQNASPARKRDAEGSGIGDAGLGARKELEIAILGAMALRGAS